jgi:4-hydroxybenzoate polyprenyltransferase
VKLTTLLTLGRTSNLPTVWSNLLCGTVLSGRPAEPLLLLLLLVVGSLFYEGGMFLNDAFDAEIDARERPGRPIPAGLAKRSTVYWVGGGLLLAGFALLLAAAAAGLLAHALGTLMAGAGTVLAILVYNRWHKGHAFSPIVMGACRAGLYLMAALATSTALSQPVLLGAAALLLYVVGLTHVARFETSSLVARAWPTALLLAPLALALYELTRSAFATAWSSWLLFALLLLWILHCLRFALGPPPRKIPRAVVRLITGIALADALFISVYGAPLLTLPALGAFAVTLRWQRRIPGT